MNRIFKSLFLCSILLIATESHAISAKKIGAKTVKFSDGSIRKGGHRNWRNNNPGNLEYGEFAIENGAIGTDGRFAIFENMEDGFLAQVNLLTGDTYKYKTIASAIKKYVPSHENNTHKYLSKIIKELRVSRNTIIASLSEHQLLKMVKVMASLEGMKRGVYIES